MDSIANVSATLSGRFCSLDSDLPQLKTSDQARSHRQKIGKLTPKYVPPRRVPLAQQSSSVDILTGLPNRDWLLERLKQLFAYPAQRPFALILIDIDGLRLINRRFGNQIGDGLIQEMSHRIRKVLRHKDVLSRWDSDGLAVILTDLTSEAEAQAWMSLLQQQLRQPFQLDGRSLFATASVGLAASIQVRENRTGATAQQWSTEQLIQYAEEALENAKQLGRGKSCCFDPRRHEAEVERMQLENELRQAIAGDQLVVHYQPIIHLATGELEGFEALVRWKHPKRGLLLPGEFIAMAEETGLILPLGHWVLRQACQQLHQWQRCRAQSKRLVMSVNLSPRQLTDPRLVKQVRQVLAETKIAPQQLRLELTENVVMENLPQGRSTLKALRQQGISLSIDDFGTGYSSLSYLDRLPVNTLKIDRSFIHRMGKRGERGAIVKAIVAMAQSLGLETVAEGVSTPQQVAYLRSLGCDKVQGGYFAMPLQADHALTWIAQAA